MFNIFGCSSHHYGEEEHTGRIKTIPNDIKTKVLVEHQVKRECVHENCNKVKKEWKRVKKVRKKRMLRLLDDPDALERETVVVEPIFGGVTQDKIFLPPGSTMDLTEYSENALQIQVNVE